MTRRPVRSMPAALQVALAIAGALHGGLLLAGSYRRTYDAYVHLFFADHYRRDWFSTWEPRWYTGFTTVSYPPGSHQLLALVSKVVGLEQAFVPVALGAVLLLVVGVYRFSRIWVDERAAGCAAILCALSSAIAEALHVFGQLPTLLSLALLLNGLPFAHRFIRDGGVAQLVAAVACAAATTAVHHVTTLFGSVFFLGPVMVHALLDRMRAPRDGETGAHAVRLRLRQAGPLVVRRLRRVLPALVRAAVYGGLVLTGLVVVVLPYWLYSSRDPITQIPIPHASRDNYLHNLNAGLIFWVIPWGVLILALPYALIRGVMGSTWPLAASVGLLTLLGTGGTTPLPKLILGGAYEVLTLDRFTFWATIAILPLAGRLVQSLIDGRLSEVLSENLGRALTRALSATLAVAVIAASLFSANLGAYRPTQPSAIDMAPVVAFIDKDQHDRWRYLTLGFGDQMAWLGAQTTAETVDGNYHSARRLPELTSTPVERLEGAKYTGIPGLGSLQQFLAVPEKYHLKFVFSNDQFYDPLLSASGWEYLGVLSNGIAVWQRDDVTPLPAARPHPELPMWQRLMWGLLPMAAIASAGLVLVLHGVGARWPLRLRIRHPRPVRAAWRVVDRRLALIAARVPAEGEQPVWQVWRVHIARLRTHVLAPVRARRRRVQGGLLVALVGVAGFVIIGRAEAAPSPADAVYRYYDALDLRHLDDAYSVLDPQTRPTLDQYLVERSVVNGLVASYARLSSAHTEYIARTGEHATVRSTLHYITALSEYDTVVVSELRRSGDRWLLESPPIDVSIPPDELVVRPGVGWTSQGRRQVTEGATAYADIIDRPEVRIVSSRLVRHAGQLSVVGELTNIDVDPASLTVTAQLLDVNGAVMSTFDAATGAAHTALPGETVPFRIDFEGVAGFAGDGAAPAFSPAARTPLALDLADIASVEVSAKAVVTSSGLVRPLGAQAVTVADGVITGQLRNDGLDEVTVPHMFAVLREADGTVGWIDDRYIADAIRPQRSATFDLLVTPAADVEPVDIPMRLFANGQSAAVGDRTRSLLGPIGGWASIDLVMTSFTRPS